SVIALPCPIPLRVTRRILRRVASPGDTGLEGDDRVTRSRCQMRPGLSRGSSPARSPGRKGGFLDVRWRYTPRGRRGRDAPRVRGGWAIRGLLHGLVNRRRSPAAPKPTTPATDSRTTLLGSGTTWPVSENAALNVGNGLPPTISWPTRNQSG